MNKYRVLQVVPTMSRDGGVARMMWRHYRCINHQRLQFDFVTHGASDKFHDEVRALGGRVFCLKTPGSIGLSAYILAMRELIRKQGPYAVVHTHTNYQAGIVNLAARLEHVPRRICHVHGTYIDERNRLKLPIYRLLIRLTSNIRLACNQQAGRYYFGVRPFTVIANAIDLKEFDQEKSDSDLVRRQLGLTNYKMVLGHVGRFTVEKNHVFLLAILRDLRASGINAGLVLVGDGPLQADVMSRVQSMGVGQHVRFLGVRTDIPQLMGAFDALLLPSLSEGQPTVVVEAQASGLPCMISDGITREIDMGLKLVHYGPLSDSAIWAQRLPVLCRTPRLDPQEILAGITRSRFNIHHNVAALTAIYEEMAGHGNACR
jgi:glycosyltransferase EpsF